MNNIYYTDTDNTIHLDKEIGHGGEGKVYTIHGYLSDVAKIYFRQQPLEVHRKILTMVQNPPDDPTVNGPSKHRSIAWPNELLYLDRQKSNFAGFIMPRVDMKVFIKLLYYASPGDRIKRFQGGFTWLHLFTTGFNLASCLAAIHERGYCVGDINESNILVAPSTPLTIIDCDSFQVEDPSSKKMWRCKVGKVDFTAPEILDYRYEDIDRTKETDCFALAVILFQLLMEGFHPYAASGKLVDDAPTTRDKIRKGVFPYARSIKGIAPPRDAPPFDILSSDIQELFYRCFQIGHKTPTERPSAKEWMDIFKKRSLHFKKCTDNENHRFLDHLSACPWCDRAKKTGKDTFPSPIGQQIILQDPASKIISLEDRKTYLTQYIEMALVDGYISHDEEEYLIDQGLKLHLSEKETKKLIENEVQRRGISAKAVTIIPKGIPKLEVSKTRFNFFTIKKGVTISDSFTISNVGGGALNGLIKTNKKWLKVSQSNIDTGRHKQDITFYVDPSNLAFGFKDAGRIEIQSNGGTESVFVEISVEMPEEDLSRFRSGLTIGGLFVGGLFGYLVYNINFIQGMNVNVAGIAGIAAIIGAIVAAGWLGYQDGGGGAAFGWGCGTLVVGGIILAILESYFPHALSTFSWTLAYGSFGYLLSRPIRRALWQGDVKKPITIAAVTLALTVGIIIVGFVSAKEERQNELAKMKAIQTAIREIRTKLPGEWHGNVGNSMAKLFISKESGQLSGKMVYQGVEEQLLVDVRNKDGQIIIVLKGINYKRVRGKGRFNLDTFYATLSSGILKGNFVDAAGKKGTWSVSKLRPRSVNVTGIWEGRWKKGGLVNPLSPSEMSFTLSIQQEDSRLTGAINYHDKKGTSKIKGHLRHLFGKNQISFKYSYSDGTVMSYQGTVNIRGDEAAGKWTGNRYSGSWKMTKVKMKKVRQSKAIFQKTLASEANRGRLFVETIPVEAKIRILNIRPKFYQGMELEPGRYHVEVSAKGYKTKKEWHDHRLAGDQHVKIILMREKEKVVPKDTAQGNRSLKPKSKNDYATRNEELDKESDRREPSVAPPPKNW